MSCNNNALDKNLTIFDFSKWNICYKICSIYYLQVSLGKTSEADNWRRGMQVSYGVKK